MVDLVIKTNNQARDIMYWNDLTAKECKEFDYLDTAEKQDQAMFFLYRGVVYDIGEFMRTDMFPKWDGYKSDSLYSGVLVRWANEFESVVVATYYS